MSSLRPALFALLLSCNTPGSDARPDLASPGPGPDLASGDLAAPADLAASQDGVYRCDLRSAPAPMQYCQEYQGLNTQALLSAYQSACTGAWARSPCVTQNSLGGCRARPAMGIVITNWFYPGSYPDARAVEQGCIASMGTYLSP